MGYYKNLLLRSFDAVGKDRADGINNTDAFETANAILQAEKNASTMKSAYSENWVRCTVCGHVHKSGEQHDCNI